MLTLRTHDMIFGGMHGKLLSKNSFWKWISCGEGENDEMSIPNYRDRLRLNKAGFFEGSFFWLRSICPPFHTSRRTNITIQLLNNLSSWNLQIESKKNADICYMLPSSEQLVNIEGENLHIFWITWGISLKFSEKAWLMIIFKVTKKIRSLSYSFSL